MSMYYNYRKIEGYNIPIMVIVGPRGLGKTFGVLLTKGIYSFVNKGDRFIYVVETKDMVDTLAQNKGEKFFSAILEYLHNNPSNKHNRILDKLLPSDTNNTEVESGEIDELSKSLPNKIIGGTIKIGGETAGYLIALNDFANIKRNNFTGVKTIIVDEFIPEQIDIRHLQNPRKLISIIQSIARLKYIKIYLLGNSIRPNDIILTRLGLDNMKPGEFRVIKDKYGPLIVGNMVDRREYQEYSEKQDASVAGRLATLMREDNLDKNSFSQALTEDLLIPSSPKASHLLFCIHGEGGSIRVNVTKDHSEYYVLNDYGINTKLRICFEERFASPVVRYIKEYRDMLLLKYQAGEIKFESDSVHLMFKVIMKLNL